MYPKIEKTDLGSSSKTGKKLLDGIMEPDDKRYCQHTHREWNKVWVKYCDGSIWNGATHKSHTSNETFNTHTHTHNTVTAVFQDLAKKTSVNKTDAFTVFAGGSAGV